MTNHPEQQFLDLLKNLLEKGDERIDRTGVGTRAIFGQQMRFDLSQGFPAFTTKQVFWKTAFKEILWMLSGGRNIKELLAQNVHIWSDWPHKKYVDKTCDKITMKEFEEKVLESDEFAKKWGDLGPVYGYQWRHWEKEDGSKVDQIQWLLDELKNNPTSR
ncbi:MAG: thymidylate synthase, partial [Gammaproteobacteria bacterium]|nr:thymidylate synthase [Gammaproteobacteria bacterium]